MKYSTSSVAVRLRLHSWLHTFALLGRIVCWWFFNLQFEFRATFGADAGRVARQIVAASDAQAATASAVAMPSMKRSVDEADCGICPKERNQKPSGAKGGVHRARVDVGL